VNFVSDIEEIIVGYMKARLWVAVLISLFSISPALAHTSLLSAVPLQESTVTESPERISLLFNEELILIGEKNPNDLQVIDESGARISGEVLVDGANISTESGITGPGTYTVKYRVASADGHIVEGDYRFSVAVPLVSEVEDGPNLLIRFSWILLVIAGLGTFALLRFRK
jgi:methionine-rich copper-binding protein CopC